MTVTTTFDWQFLHVESDAIPLGQAGIGSGPGTVGVYNLNGGVLNLDPSFGILDRRRSGTGTLNLNGGVANLNGGNYHPASGHATFNFQGGTA